ncbi:MAG: hypothetical protein GF355_15760 [Candidatus Eisenbacteria bacterium]|nr:hypothetical protein [Candidatus Eisenbacteria bacterium]
MVYRVPVDVSAFETILGIDHAGRQDGSAVVTIEVDDLLAVQSPVLTAESGGFPVRIAVAPGQRLTIRIDPTEDGKRQDHVDLALARFVPEQPQRPRPGDHRETGD